MEIMEVYGRVKYNEFKKRWEVEIHGETWTAYYSKTKKDCLEYAKQVCNVIAVYGKGYKFQKMIEVK